jgi:hypothetical protein
VEDFEPLYMSEDLFATNPQPPEYISTYVGIFTAFTNMLSGNISLAPYENPDVLAVEEMSSKVLESSLFACEDVMPTFWIDYWNTTLGYSTSDVSSVFTGTPWMCRNKTLALAMEDLFNNITISMLSLNIP